MSRRAPIVFALVATLAPGLAAADPARATPAAEERVRAAEAPRRHCKHHGGGSAARAEIAGTSSAFSPEQLEALRAAPAGLTSTLVPAGKTKPYGHVEILVHAPSSIVLQQATAFGQYKDLNPWRFKQSRIVGREGDKTDVYFQVTALKGLLTLWQVLRFAPPAQTVAGVSRIDGTFVRGNVEDAGIVLDLHRIDDRTTVIAASLRMELDVPVPGDELDKTLRDAVAGAMRGMRDKAEAMYRAESER